ncbi:MAG: glycoside hydrolase [Rikenellaceae bacterium]
MKKNFFTLLALLATVSLAEAQTVDLKKSTEVEFDHFWSTGCGAGRANEGLRADWLEQLKQAHEDCGFRYVRMHGLFHDDMHICHLNKNGKMTYSWQYVDVLFDRMLDMGVRPFVELGFFPEEIAAENSKTQFWWKANVTVDPDKTFPMWADLVKNFTQHVVDRYGIDEVRTWYFEVWNEPNLSGSFLDGTKSDYFNLYKLAVTEIKNIDSELRVGGPSTSNFTADERYSGEKMDHSKSRFYNNDIINKQQWKAPWMEDFLAFCQKEKLPVDFISTHPYPTDYALDPEVGRSKSATRYINSTRDDIQWLNDILAKSKYPNAEIHLTEWSTSPNSRDRMHDELPPAAFILKTNLQNIGKTNSLMYWTFTDVFEEKGGGEDIFHGGFGMLNLQGIVKPSYHAYRMLNQLGDKMIYNTDPVCVTRNSKNDKIVALAYNYPEEYISTVPASNNVGSYMKSSSKDLDFTITGLTPNATVFIETLDNENGNVMFTYRAMGKPHSPTREQIKMLKEAAWNTQKEALTADKNGTLTIKRELTPWSCLLITEM